MQRISAVLAALHYSLAWYRPTNNKQLGRAGELKCLITAAPAGSERRAAAEARGCRRITCRTKRSKVSRCKTGERAMSSKSAMTAAVASPKGKQPSG